jgi:hypothetical protein
VGTDLLAACNFKKQSPIDLLKVLEVHRDYGKYKLHVESAKAKDRRLRAEIEEAKSASAAKIAQELDKDEAWIACNDLSKDTDYARNAGRNRAKMRPFTSPFTVLQERAQCMCDRAISTLTLHLLPCIQDCMCEESLRLTVPEVGALVKGFVLALSKAFSLHEADRAFAFLQQYRQQHYTHSHEVSIAKTVYLLTVSYLIHLRYETHAMVSAHPLNYDNFADRILSTGFVKCGNYADNGPHFEQDFTFEDMEALWPCFGEKKLARTRAYLLALMEGMKLSGRASCFQIASIWPEVCEFTDIDVRANGV